MATPQELRSANTAASLVRHYKKLDIAESEAVTWLQQDGWDRAKLKSIAAHARSAIALLDCHAVSHTDSTIDPADRLALDRRYQHWDVDTWKLFIRLIPSLSRK